MLGEVEIVALGDSLTEGFGVAPWESYPARLQDSLAGAGLHCRVVNAGISGDTCRGVLQRLEGIRVLEPDLVILEIGINDVLMGAQPERIRNNITTIVQHLRDDEVTVALAGMELPPGMDEELRRSFAAVYAGAAEAPGVHLIPSFTRPLWASRERLQSDGLHPTAEGYEAITAYILPWVVRLVEGLRTV